MPSLDASTLILTIPVLPQAKADFLNWQSKFRSKISQTEGFSSLEILSPFAPQSNTWILNLRFMSSDNLSLWLKSEAYAQLIQKLTDCHMVDSPHSISKETPIQNQNGVTEIYVAQVDRDNLEKFHQWHEKIHQIESTFPGFQSVYFQAPSEPKKEGTWITLLQFNTAENLENWLNSPERSEILKESQNFITSKESHRLLSSFGGWFTASSLSANPPMWKQALLILAVLFPIVMIQFIYLTPHLSSINLSFRTFIENMICVTLMTWPFLPLAIYALKWWLELKDDPRKELLGIGILILVYSLEITIFLKLSPS